MIKQQRLVLFQSCKWIARFAKPFEGYALCSNKKSGGTSAARFC
jgi:hypothetical protein